MTEPGSNGNWDEDIDNGFTDSGSPENEDIADQEDQAYEPIAVIGFTGRFPGAGNTAQFWENLREGVESVKFFTVEELARENIDPELLKNPKFVSADAVLDDMDLFDADFFGYSPREAEIMDPQHRLFLMAAWEVLEHAGYDSERYDGRVGVYAGSGLSSYLIRNLLRNSEYVDSVGSFQTMLANGQDFLATKVSFKMNLMGPSVNCNTLCSSSMVGIHLACQSLWNYNNDMCIAGGVSLQVSRNEAFFYQEGGIGAFDGHCRAFDRRANGTVSGSGLGVVALKRLEDAVADGDTIHALIRGSAINNDGALKISYTAPSIEGQAEVITEAMSVGNIDPATISYVECHGTGTSLGDPIEIAGLTKAFRTGTEQKQFCGVGSVKTNIGHLVSAGGVASLIKTVLALKHKQIPPSINFEQANPKIDFDNSPFYVVDRLRPWEVPAGTPRRAGVSSFGIGGTNAHLIVEEAPQSRAGDPDSGYRLWLLSARNAPALEQARDRLRDHLAATPDLNLADAAYTLQIGRKLFGQRMFVVAEGRDQAVAALSNHAVQDLFQEQNDAKLTFMFTGQGSQYAGMTRDVYRSEPVFRRYLDQCADLLQADLDLDLRELLYPQADREVWAQTQLQRTRYTQPALFSVSYALARLLQSWGLQAEAMIGHSIGEYVAATLAGVFSLETALTLVAARGRLIDELPGGSMLAVPLPEAELTPLLDETLSLAVINGAANCVVSGTATAVEALAARLEAQKITSRLLLTSHAFHSLMMEPALSRFEALVAEHHPAEPKIPYISNLTGTWITAEQACDPHYYARHLRETVRFHDGLSSLLASQTRLLVEVGPGRSLVTLVQKHPHKGPGHHAVNLTRHPRDKNDDLAVLLNGLGRLWQWGAAIDWQAFQGESQRSRLPLPTYPFQLRRYWIEPDLGTFNKTNGSESRRDLLGVRKSDMADWAYLPVWQRGTPLPAAEMSARGAAWLVFLDHSGLGARLVTRLREEGQRVVSVSAGAEYARVENDYFRLNSERDDDYIRLLNDLAVEGFQVGHVVYGFALDQDRASTCFGGVLRLMGALQAGLAETSLSLTLLARGAGDALGERIPAHAALLGFSRVVAQEVPGWSARVIDLAVEKDQPRLAERLTGHLHSELLNATGGVVALDGRHRWRQTLEPRRLEPLEGASTEEVPRMGGPRDGGFYLVAGGLSGLGLEIADHLAKNYRAKLLLSSISEFPPMADWHRATTGPQAATIARLQAMMAAGTQLRICAGAAEAELGKAVAEARALWGGIHGVWHTEGIYGRDVFMGLNELRPAHFERQYQVKLASLRALERALGDLPVAWCQVVSSLSTVLGGLGLAAFAAAHHCGDAFVSRHNLEHAQPWTSLAWDGWLQTAGGELEGSQAAAMAIGLADGMQILERATSQNVEQLFISSEDLPARLQQLDSREVAEAEPKELPLHPRPALPIAFAAPRNPTEERIAQIWQRRLGVEQVGVHDSFFDLGGDSLIVVKIRSDLNAVFGKELLTSDLFEYPTVATLAGFFAQKEAVIDQDRVKSRAAQRKAAMSGKAFGPRKRF